jgi:hypothetical protein
MLMDLRQIIPTVTLDNPKSGEPAGEFIAAQERTMDVVFEPSAWPLGR